MMVQTSSNIQEKFHPAHWADLMKSGLSPETIQRAGIKSVPPDQINKTIGFDPKNVKSCLEFPYPNISFSRVKTFPPYTDNQGHQVKYLQPKGSGVHLYIPVGCEEKLHQIQTPIYFTEGEKKSLKASQEGIFCLGLGGVWNFKNKGDDGLINEIKKIPFLDREVFFIPDSDFLQNENVRLAVYQFGNALEKQGAKFQVVCLPLNSLSEKIGIDDYLIEHSTQEFFSLPRINLKNKIFESFKKSNTFQLDHLSIGKNTQAKKLIELGKGAEYFHQDDTCFATITVGRHKENWPIRSRGFRKWILKSFYELESRNPSTTALQEAIDTLEGLAAFNSPGCPVYTRIAFYNENIYFFLANDNWEVVEISKTGWRIVEDSPVKFWRPRGMVSLPVPRQGGTLKDIRGLINITEKDWPLLVGWILGALKPTGPFPILVLYGEQGSGKSVLCRLIRGIIDPNLAPLRPEPRNERDLIIAANNGWLIVLDNLSHLPLWLSDALCRLSTGGGFGTRENYSDRDEALFEAQRPIIINGIEELATRGDLLDRAIIIYLPPIPDANRMSEEKLWKSFEENKPKFLGVFFDFIVGILQQLPHVELKEYPRMADFALWATAAEKGLGWENGFFLRQYLENKAEANVLSLNVSPIVNPLRKILEVGPFNGTATELLETLEDHVDDRVKKAKTWPSGALSLSNNLRRLVPSLRRTGIEVTFIRGEKRLIHIEDIRNIPSQASESSINNESPKPDTDVFDDNDGLNKARSESEELWEAV